MSKKTKVIISLVTDILLAIIMLTDFILYILGLIVIEKLFTCVLLFATLMFCVEWVLNDIIRLRDIKIENLKE